MSGLALSVIASRCHLSQSERPWQSAKFPVPHFTPCCRKGSRRRFAQTFRLCQGLPLWGSWREAPERARTLPGRLRPGLAGAYDGADFRKPQSKLTRCVLVSGLALSVIASRCHLSQSERPWQSVKFPVWNLYALLPQRSRQALRSDFPPLPRAPTLGELDAVRRPERASPLPWPLSPSLAGAFGRPRASPAEGRLHLCLAQRTARQRGQARGQLNLNIWRKILWYIVSTLKRNPASMWKPRG